MATEDERKELVKKAFFEYAEHNTLSAFDTPGYTQNRFYQRDLFLEGECNNRLYRIRDYGYEGRKVDY